MDPQNSQNTTVPGVPGTNLNPDNPLAVNEPGEQMICEIKRHPIGIIGAYIMAGFLLVVLAVFVFVVAPHIFSNMSRGRLASISALIFVIAAAIAAGFLLIMNKIYWGNRWIVSSDSITQVTRTSLFDKQTSQLSLGDLEDITAEQDGVLAQMFHFGVLSAETAAATDKFTFLFCPNPTYYAKQILAARERFEQARRGSTGATGTDTAQQLPPSTPPDTTPTPPPAAASPSATQ